MTEKRGKKIRKGDADARVNQSAEEQVPVRRLRGPPHRNSSAPRRACPPRLEEDACPGGSSVRKAYPSRDDHAAAAAAAGLPPPSLTLRLPRVFLICMGRAS